MATPKINENCHYVQNDPHKCKIKLEKFHFDILCRFGVIKESLPGGGIRPSPSEIGLSAKSDLCFKAHLGFCIQLSCYLAVGSLIKLPWVLIQH